MIPALQTGLSRADLQAGPAIGLFNDCAGNAQGASCNRFAIWSIIQDRAFQMNTSPVRGIKNRVEHTGIGRKNLQIDILQRQ